MGDPNSSVVVTTVVDVFILALVVESSFGVELGNLATFSVECVFGVVFSGCATVAAN